MMKQDYFCLTFVSTIFISFYILGSINTVEGLKCYICGPNEPNECKDVKPEYLTECDVADHACFLQDGEDDYLRISRGCEKSDVSTSIGEAKSKGYKTYDSGEMKCFSYSNRGNSKCYCETEGCNDKDYSIPEDPPPNKKDVITSRSRTKNGGAVLLSQMSLWIFFAFPVAVTWMSVFASGHHHLI